MIDAQGRRGPAPRPASRRRATAARTCSRSSRPTRATSCSRPTSTTCTSSPPRAAPAGAPPDPAVPAPRRLRPVHVLPGLPAARPLHDADAAADGGDPARGVRRRERRLHHPRLGVGAGPAALRRPRRRAAQTMPEVDAEALERAAGRRHPHLGRGLRRGAARRASARRTPRGCSRCTAKAFPEAYKEDFPARAWPSRTCGTSTPLPATADDAAAQPVPGARRRRERAPLQVLPTAARCR